MCAIPTWAASWYSSFKCQLCSQEKKGPHRGDSTSPEETSGYSDKGGGPQGCWLLFIPAGLQSQGLIP